MANPPTKLTGLANGDKLEYSSTDAAYVNKVPEYANASGTGHTTIESGTNTLPLTLDSNSAGASLSGGNTLVLSVPGVYLLIGTAQINYETVEGSVNLRLVQDTTVLDSISIHTNGTAFSTGTVSAAAVVTTTASTQNFTLEYAYETGSTSIQNYKMTAVRL